MFLLRYRIFTSSDYMLDTSVMTYQSNTLILKLVAPWFALAQLLSQVHGISLLSITVEVHTAQLGVELGEHVGQLEQVCN